MTTLNAEIYQAMKETAEEINSIDKTLGGYALRKVAHLSENSPLETLIKYSNDLVLMATKMQPK